MTEETVSTAESQKDEFHVDKVRNTRDQYIFILEFKIDVHPILGGLGEEKESTTLLTAIRTPKLWNDHDEVRGVYPQA